MVVTVQRITDKFRQPYAIYVSSISAIGAGLFLWNIISFRQYSPFLLYIVLLLLALSAQTVVTSVNAGSKSSVTYDLHNAIAIVTVPLYGPLAPIFIVVAADIVLWLLKPAKEGFWKRSFEQLAFNIGMHVIAIAAAGWSLTFLTTQLETYTLLQQIIPWLTAAVIYSQLNLWLLITVIWLQHGQSLNPLSIWQDNLWASAIDIIVMFVGGRVLAFAVAQYDLVGTAIFFLPILLTAFAFRIYVNRMQSHMSNLETIIKERTTELRDVMREKDAYLAVLTHDMKTPLTSIGLYVELIQRHPEIIKSKPHMLQILERNQQALLTIVNDILDLEKLNVDGEIVLHQEPFDLMPVLEHVVQTLSMHAAEKSLTVHQDTVLEPIILKADRAQIERVFMNLISNAVKYTPSGGEIGITAGRTSEEIVVKVCDNGYGIPADDLPYVFDRFRRVAAHQNKARGTGLGLAITKAIVEAHGGKIWVQSEVDKGSTFEVRLPAI